MLRKLFPPLAQAGNSSNNNSSKSILPSKAITHDEEACDVRTGFVHSITQLDQFETHLRDLLRTLTRHCQAITDMCASTTSFSEQLRLLASDPHNDDQQHTASHLKRPASDEAVGLVNMFRVSAIAPLQSLLILVPQLRLRCEHRRSALQLMLRYQHKVSEMERVSKTKSESTKLQRNRAKLQAASVRFRELDGHVQREIRSLVANDIAGITSSPIRELLLRAQQLAGQAASESAAHWQSQLVSQVPHNELDKKSPSEPIEPQQTQQNEEDPSQGALHSQQLAEAVSPPTPQRRMAMTVLPHAEDTTTHMYVRQSILAPPPAQSLVCVARSNRSITPQQHSSRCLSNANTTQTDDDDGTEHEQDNDGDDDDGGEKSERDDSFVGEMPEIHEDFGIGKRKKHAHGSRRWDIHQQIKDTLATSLDLIDAVRLPDGLARDEWIAVHVVDFFNEINLLYGTISEFCTPESCPRMSAGPCYAYTWASPLSSFSCSSVLQDGAASGTATGHLPASQYVAKLMDWIETQISDPSIFPMASCSTYSSDFEEKTAAVILKRLFRVYAHMYHSHLEHFAELSAEMHLGFCFKRFVFFIKQFDLVEQKELNALRKLIQSVMENPVSELVPEPGNPALLS